MSARILVAMLASSVLLALCLATPSSAVSGTQDRFYGEWVDYNINGDTGVWTRLAYVFYTNGSGTFAHAGNDYDVPEEWFTWTVNANGTLTLIRSYGTSCYPYSFNSAYSDLTITMDGGHDYTFDKVVEFPEEETEVAFCGGVIIAPAAGMMTALAGVILIRHGRN